MQTITGILNSIAAIPPEVWITIGGVIGASAIQQKIKKWFQLQNPKFLVFLTGLFSLLGVVMVAAIGWINTQPQLMVSYGAVWFTGMTIAYRYVVQPLGETLGKWNGEVKAYKAYKSAQSGELVPELVVPEDIVNAAPVAPVAATVESDPNVFQG